MDKNSKIAIIGAGAMGSSILRGWMATDVHPADVLEGDNFIVVDPSDDKRMRLSDELGVHAFEDVAQASCVFDVPDIVLLAVKPQVLDDVLSQVLNSRWLSSADSLPLIVSIAAGIPTSHIEVVLGGIADSDVPSGVVGDVPNGVDGDAARSIHVVRVMPNLPLQVTLGASVIAKGSCALDDEAQLVCDLFASLGFASLVDELQIDAVCAISGGGPAYVAKMIEDLTSAGVKAGLSEELSQKLAITTVGGSYKLLDETSMSPESLRVAVCSPGGTTLAALAAMDNAGFSQSIGEGIEAAIKRAKELAQ